MVVCVVVFGAWWADSTYMRARFPQILAIQLIRQIVKGAAFGKMLATITNPFGPST